MHDDIEDTGVVKMLQQSDTVPSFHFEPTTKVVNQRHKPVLHAARVTAVAKIHNSQSDFFSARQHAERAICYRKSVCLFITRVDQSKMVELRVMQFSPYSSPIPLLYAV